MANEYNPPSSKVINGNQNKTDSLRLLLAQRALYSRAKRWLALRLIGIGIIAIAAPLIALIWPKLSIITGAVASTWIALGQTLFMWLEKRLSSRAAAVQELFDIKVFGMPNLGERSPTPSLEEIAHWAGSDDSIVRNAKSKKILDWYTINSSDAGTLSVAISQRANASYSTNLLKTTSRLWVVSVSTWLILLVVISSLIHLDLGTFILGVFLPLLPALYETGKYWWGIKRATDERNKLRSEIEMKIADNSLSEDDLLIWQTKMYDLRRNAPLVFDFVYKRTRNANEESMISVARQLSALGKQERRP